MNNKKEERVSIITISQWSRKKFITLLVECIKRQTYTNIIEWLVVDGSKTIEDQEAFAEYFPTLTAILNKARPEIKVRFFSDKEDGNKKIGHLRNVGNDNVDMSCDIIIAMDDDDYYPQSRITQTVKMMRKDKKKLIAGCCNHYCYDPDIDVIFQFSNFSPNHTINTCMSYRKEFLENHRYDDSLAMGEEEAFTNKFSEPMVTIEPKHSVVQFCHSTNTFDKRTILFNNLIMPEERRYCFPMLSMKLEDIIQDKEMRELYETLFTPREYVEEEITFYCGHLSIEWDPRDKSLGGSEQAVVELSEHFSKLGYKVVVYAKVPQHNLVHCNVLYKQWQTFQVRRKYRVLILWRLYGMIPILSLKILSADRVVVDLHDNVKDSYDLIEKYKDKISLVSFKSNFHYQCHKIVTGKDLIEEKIFICPNGVRVDNFKNNVKNFIRNPYRLCYTSSYSRGLQPFLQYAWPIIKNLEKRSEIHVYYGMVHETDENFKTNMNKLLNQEGVYDHGRRRVEDIAEEKHRSKFHVYFSPSLEEIDCIAVKESLVAGCIPILSNFGVFQEREGIHVKLDPKDPNSYIALAQEVVILMHSDTDSLSEKFKHSKTICTWQDVAEKWINSFSYSKQESSQ